MTEGTAKGNTPTRTLARGLVLAGALGASALLTGCRSDMAAVQQAPIVDGNAATDPANVNMAAPVVGAAVQPVFDAARAERNGYAPQRTRVAGESYSAPSQQGYAETYPAQDSRGRNEAYNYNTQPPQYPVQQNTYGDDDQLYSELLDSNVPLAQQAPPPLPVYEQPAAPGPDYLWTPGYWDYQNTGYYYVPGNWVAAPFVGALWTPGWWGYTGRGYGWHRGYWGRHVGYYGGVNYGFGFLGTGYQGGYWNNDHFQYNRAVNHVDPRTVNNYVYQRNLSVVNNAYINNTRVSYNGGPGGLQRRPLPAEFAAAREVHMQPLAAQVAERQAAAQNRQQFFSANGDRPQQVFAARPVVERNVNVPAQLARPQQFNGGVRNGFGNGAPGAGNGFNRGPVQRGNAQPQGNAQQEMLQRQQLQNTQRQQAEQLRQQGNLQRQQMQAAGQQREQVFQQQRAQEQARNQQQANDQRQQQARMQQEGQQQRLQQQAQFQQRAAQQQDKRQQAMRQQQQAQQQREQFNQQRVQQQQIQQQQREQAVQQRAVQQQALQQQAVRQQQQQAERQQQVQQQQREQLSQQRAVQQQAAQQMQQRQQQVQQQRSAPQPQPQFQPQRPAQPHGEDAGHNHGH